MEVIPGITSAIAGPEGFGIPLTKKGRISSVGIVTGRKRNPNAAIDAPACDTLIYLMAVANIKNVVKALRKSGRSDDSPCAFIERATSNNSRIVRATIKLLSSHIRQQYIPINAQSVTYTDYLIIKPHPVHQLLLKRAVRRINPAIQAHRASVSHNPNRQTQSCQAQTRWEHSR